MAYDPDLTNAQFPMEKLPESVRANYTPIGYNLEPELKISIKVPSSKSLHSISSPSEESSYVQDTFLNFAKSFHRTTLGHASYIDMSGITPRDYALVNLGQDTGRSLRNWVLPEMKIAKNGYQYRERFALAVFADIPVSDLHITKFDANAKTLLSEGIHRKEFETSNDSGLTSRNSFEKFRQIQDLPDFFQEINPDELYVIKAWMTSRTSFLSMTQVPGTGLYALCEHCCDITKYTTANFEQFINGGRQDPEWETEIKGFYGVDNRLESEKGQMEIIEILFRDIFNRMSTINPDVTTHTLSKMERAKAHTSDFYYPVSLYKDAEHKNNPISKHLDGVRICAGLAHAFTHAIRPQEVTSDSYLPRMISLASTMPNPKNILNTSELEKHVANLNKYSDAYKIG